MLCKFSSEMQANRVTREAKNVHLQQNTIFSSQALIRKTKFTETSKIFIIYVISILYVKNYKHILLDKLFCISSRFLSTAYIIDVTWPIVFFEIESLVHAVSKNTHYRWAGPTFLISWVGRRAINTYVLFSSNEKH